MAQSIKCAECLSVLIVSQLQCAALRAACRHVYLCTSQLRLHPACFWAEGQRGCWIPELPAVVRSPEGTVHLVNMAGAAASTGLADT